MQQRQLRLGDILDDYCPRERRLTNHAVVAMVGDDVRQTRCTTCDAEHEYKHARIPRQRKKGDTPAALYNQVAAGAPKRVAHDPPAFESDAEHASVDPMEPMEEEAFEDIEQASVDTPAEPVVAAAEQEDVDEIPQDDELGDEQQPDEEGPIHRRLIRASLPRPEGQQPPARPIPEFTIRQPGGGRPNRFRPRHGRGGGGGGQGQHGHQFGGNRSNGNVGGMRGGGGRPFGRPGGGNSMNRRGQGGGGRKRSK